MPRTVVQRVILARMMFANMIAGEFPRWHKICPLHGRKGGKTAKQEASAFDFIV
jgi:hypothetical protein